jgi:hypothetical protein
MTQEEIRKCEKIVELFKGMMEDIGDMCVVYNERFGFIVLEYFVDGYFEDNSNYDNAEELYQHLMGKWRFNWLVDHARANGAEEFDEFERSLTKEQRKERNKAVKHFAERFRQIMSDK